MKISRKLAVQRVCINKSLKLLNKNYTLLLQQHNYSCCVPLPLNGFTCTSTLR